MDQAAMSRKVDPAEAAMKKAANEMAKKAANKKKDSGKSKKEGASEKAVSQAINLIESETGHLAKVVRSFGKNPKVRGQTRLNFRRLGKTKKSKISPKRKWKQLKIIDIFQKPKTTKRKFTISSDSETTSALNSDLESENVSPEVPDSEENPPEESVSSESLGGNQQDTILASGPADSFPKSVPNVSRLVFFEYGYLKI